MNKNIFSTKSTCFELIKIAPAKNLDIYNKFTNWVIGEFDLYLMNESDDLKVYFPNGWFSIRNFYTNNNEALFVEIKIEGKSKITNKIMLKRLLCIYDQVVSIAELKANQKFKLLS
jgi:hypothetical protein